MVKVARLYSLIAVLLLLSASKSFADEALTFSKLMSILHDGHPEQISKVIITNGEESIQVQLQGSEHLNNVVVPTEVKANLIEQLVKDRVPLDVHETDKKGLWYSMVTSFFLPILLLLGFLFMFRSAQRQQ